VRERKERKDERGPRVEWIASSSLRMMEYVLSAQARGKIIIIA
jgi:hypothetical protein